MATQVLPETDPLDADAQFTHALVAAGEGDHEGAVQAMERAHQLYLDSGDKRGALRAATKLVVFNASGGQYSAANGWDERGRRIADSMEPCVEAGYHAVAWVGCEIRDPAELLRRAEEARDIGVQFGDRQLELRGLADRGLALVTQGKVDEGTAVLDDVMVAIAAGEMPTAMDRGLAFCALMSACERTGDHGRADYWGGAIERDPEAEYMGILVTHCQVAQGVVNSMRGQWEGASSLLEQAIQSKKSIYHHAVTARATLADLELQQGRYEKAAELLQGLEDDYDASPVLARLRIAQGDLDSASSLLRVYTRGGGSDCLRMAPALAQLVDVDISRGDEAAASRTLRKLQSLEEGECSSNEVRAFARAATARVESHRGDHDAAIENLETALALLTHRDRPVAIAKIRLELARAYARAGEKGSAAIEARAAKAAFERLGIVHDRGLAEALLAEVGPGAAPTETAVGAPELTGHEVAVAALVGEGLSDEAISGRLDIPAEKVQTQVDRALGKLDITSRDGLAGWGRGETVARDRVLATVLFTDIVGSTEKLVAMGDRAWRELLDAHDRVIEELVAEHDGRIIDRTGDGILATFDGPKMAIECARRLRDALGKHGIDIRTGIHTGEIELRGDRIGGVNVHLAARVMSKAGAGEIVVSSTVRDVAAGSGMEFTELGDYELKGLPGTWRLLMVA